MSADILRKAAEAMRAEANAVRRPFMRDERFKIAVADWLEHEAEYVEQQLDTDGTTAHALSVARAFLGEAS